MVVVLASPKQPQSEHLKDWYPYYAGFRSEFAADVFDLYIGSAESVIDPWNGSGTTTAVAAERGVKALGIDINPALSIVARARLTPRSIADSLVPIAGDIAGAAERIEPAIREYEPLSTWLQPAAFLEIRRLQRAIHVVTAADDALEADLQRGDNSAPSRLPLITAFFYSALFAATRDLLRTFRGTNPTWLITPSSPRNRLRPSTATVHDRFIARADYLCSRLQITRPDSDELATIQTGIASKALSHRDSFDACLTSPPYATRIDYVKGSLPELSVVGLSQEAIDALRRQSTGTPVVRGVDRVEVPLPDLARKLVDQVAGHESHGSANYYAPWLHNYLADLHGTLAEVSRSVVSSGRIAVVVQDSYYKSLHIDLQRLVTQSIAATGRELIARHDFDVRHSMSNMNPKARTHLQRRKHMESLLVYE